MPTVAINGTHIHYEDSDQNNTSKPVMVFAHGLLLNTRLYDKQVAYFQDKYRCIAFDFRGHGQSEISEAGYDMDNLTEDAVALIHHLGITHCYFIGLSMGGFVGMRLAIRYPHLLHGLILLDTSADEEPKRVRAKYNRLLQIIKVVSLKCVSKKMLPLIFGKTFLSDKSRKKELKIWKKQIESNDKKGISRASRAVIEREAIYDQLDQIKTPTLIGVGSEDITTRYKKSERLHFAITGSKLVVFDKAGHLPTIEAPKQVNTAIDTFLQKLAE